MKTRLILWILLSSYNLYAAEVKFYSMNTIHGISMRETFSVCKDKHGFIWSSSKTGILRITEDNYRIYRLPHQTVGMSFVKLIYKNGQLVAYTNNGQFFVYDETYDRFDFLIDLRELLHNDYVTVSNMVIDSFGTFWIGSSNGLYTYRNHLLFPVEDKPHSIQYISFLDDNQLLCADLNTVEVFNTETSNTILVHRNQPEYSIQVSGSYYDEENRTLWIGTFSHGLYIYDFNASTFSALPIKGFPRQPVLTIKHEENENTLLVGIDGQGIWKLNPKTQSVLNIYKEDINNSFSLRGDGVYDIFCEKNKVWVATYSGGLSFFEQNTPLVNHITHQINNSNSLGNNDVHQMLEDHKGDIWFTTNNGISRWTPSTNQWKTYFQNKQEQAQVFLALCEDKDGNIWGGTYSSGIYVIHPDTGKELMHYSGEKQATDAPGKFIFDLYKDSENDIWIGGVENVMCYVSKEKRFRSYSLKPANSFFELFPGRILATYSHGLALLHKESGEIEKLIDGCLPHDVVVTGSSVWIATSGNGLIQYNYADKTSKQFTTDSGLPSNYLNSLLHTNGYLWIGTENGLCQLNLSDQSILTYSSILSLSNSAFNINSCTRLRNGDLVWGTNNGAILFTPDKLHQTSYEGRIFFQDIIVSGRSIRENPDLIKDTPVDRQQHITLNYNQNTLSLELLSVGASSKGIKYAWKLEGLDTEWSQPSVLPIINYANLPGGNFRLSIRMYDSSLSRIIDERSLSIRVIPPFWATWWFYILISIAVVSILGYSLRAYLNRLKQKHAKDKIRFFTSMAHDIRTSLTLISAPVEQADKAPELSEKTRYFLNLAMEQTQRLSSVATQLLDFEKVDSKKEQLFPVMTDVVDLISKRCRIFITIAEKRELTLEFSTNVDSYITAVDELKIEKTVDNLISNAIKYSHPDEKIEIFLVCEKDKWSLEVKDYGLGISAKAQKKLFREFYRGDNQANSKMVGSGIGLVLVKNYVTMHGGKLEFDSKEHTGSSFRMVIPYKKVEEAIVEAVSLTVEWPITSFAQPEDNRMEIGERRKDRMTRILIVEDNTDLQEFLQRSLEGNYHVFIANNGHEAWSLIQKEMPDLVISDIIMPQMDGFELCNLIKSTFETSHIPVILLTSLSQKTTQLEGLGLGADDYITKPFDVSLLLQRISSMVRNRERIRERTFKLINQTGQDEPVYANALNDQFVKKALEVVKQNMSNTQFGKDEFASEMHVSPSLLYQKLKALTEQSPIDFIRIIRFNHAMELLQSRRYSIVEISEMCGFSSPSYFSTAFRKYFGKSPIEISNSTLAGTFKNI